MAGGSLTITADIYGQLPAIAQSVLCWSNGNRGLVTTSSSGPVTSIVVPEAAFGVGALLLKRGGTDLVAGYVAGTHITVNVGNGGGIENNVNTCPARTNQPTVTTIVTNVGGNPRAITVNYANVAASGLVDIYWGDGTSTLGAAESGAASHTYAPTTVPFGARIRIQDATVLTDIASMVVRVP